jgi:cytochrome c2
MRRLIGLSAGLGLVLALSAGPAWAGDAEAGKKVFNKCKACHDLAAGKNKIGPSLNGLFGRTSGTVEGFKYSDAMKGAAIVWGEDTLDVGRAPHDHLAMPHHAFAVHDDNGAAAGALVFAPQAIGLRDFAFRVEIGEQRERDPAQLLGEGLMRVNAVHADAQHLGI